MPKFQIIAPHAEAQCILALDEMLAHDPSFPSEVWFGCHFGDHTGYALVDAHDESEARKRLPRSMLSRTRVVEVDQFTPDQIRESHEAEV